MFFGKIFKYNRGNLCGIVDVLVVVNACFDDMRRKVVCYNGYKRRCDEKVFDMFAV